MTQNSVSANNAVRDWEILWYGSISGVSWPILIDSIGMKHYPFYTSEVNYCIVCHFPDVHDGVLKSVEHNKWVFINQ